MQHTELTSVFCDDLAGGMGLVAGGSIGRGTVYTQLIRCAAQQRLAQHCKAIILQ